MSQYRKIVIRAVIPMLALAALAGCGQTGELYLPNRAEEAPKAPVPPPPEALEDKPLPDMDQEL